MASLRGWFAELRRRNVLRAAALYIATVWALAQGIAQLGPPLGAPDWVTRWFVIAGIMGFPFWAAFAWYYELTPEGIRRESAITPGESIARRTSRKLDFWIIGIMAVAIVLLVTNQFVLRRDPTSQADAASTQVLAAQLAKLPAQSVAVLPFANQSGDPKQDYFSDGLSEELISDLTRISGLKVIGKNSSFRFRASKESPAAIGVRLGVAHLIEGSVRQSGDRFRIIVGLVRAADGSSVWSRRYDRELADIFAVQSDIASEVASALKVTVLGDAGDSGLRPASGNVPAYEAMMLGRFHSIRYTEADFRKAIEYCRQAIQLDPGYAAAWAGLAFVNVNLGNQLPRAQREQAWTDARKALERAQALAPDLPAVVRTRIYVMASVNFDFAGALVEARRLLESTPDDPASLATMGVQLTNVGRLEDALAVYRKSIVRDPLYWLTQSTVGDILAALGRLDEAEQAYRKAWELNPSAQNQEDALAFLGLLRGDPEPALRFAAQLGDRDAKLWWEAMAWYTCGDAAKSDAALREYVDRKNGDERAYSIAVVHAWRKQPDEMFEWLDRAWEHREQAATNVLFDVFMRPYKSDPRFTAYCRKVGLPAPGEAFPGAEG